MEQKVVAVSLVAFLGLAILRAVAGVESSEAVAGAKDSNVESMPQPSKNLYRVIRSPDAGQRRPRKPKMKSGKARKGGKSGKARKGGKSGKARKARKGGKSGKEGRRRQKTGKMSEKAKKGEKKTGRKSGKARKEEKQTGIKKDVTVKRNEARQGCDEKELCKRIKLYIKYSNQLRKAKRILKTCKLLKTKSEKAATAFKETADALADSDDSDVGGIQAMLKNCSKSASEACNVTNVAQCSEDEQKKITECSTKLKAWVNAFGPGKASCLGNENCCSCINGISLDVPADCLNYEAIDESATLMKGKCTKNEGGGGKAGSFGECRKKQMEAAVKGPKAMAKKCKKGGMSSAPPMPTKRYAIRQFRKALKNKKNMNK